MREGVGGAGAQALAPWPPLPWPLSVACGSVDTGPLGSQRLGEAGASPQVTVSAFE